MVSTMCYEIKLSEGFKKKGQNTVVHTSTLDFVEPINILTFFYINGIKNKSQISIL